MGDLAGGVHAGIGAPGDGERRSGRRARRGWSSRAASSSPCTVRRPGCLRPAGEVGAVVGDVEAESLRLGHLASLREPCGAPGRGRPEIAVRARGEVPRLRWNPARPYKRDRWHPPCSAVKVINQPGRVLVGCRELLHGPASLLPVEQLPADAPAARRSGRTAAGKDHDCTRVSWPGRQTGLNPQACDRRRPRRRRRASPRRVDV